ncbi:hypothetical protein HUG10_07770 [Halorarum halophilum]|uniref:DUF7344 domain-containing protein n=1 Tax=Halorarum halophilum TaxID=2743090 RepID=A0A7D5GZF0_9EURY|nr:hypothetical protein [Halobaculum halophilum]QLG27453.1 hypothetical protein HUG10_07770 [Halobaculum halophilum]
MVSWDRDSNVVGEAPHFANTLGEMCRFALSYFRDASAELDSGDAVATARRDNDGEPRASIRFHHIALPKLAAVGLVDYDERTKTVRYHGHSRLEHIQERLFDFNSAIIWGWE